MYIEKNYSCSSSMDHLKVRCKYSENRSCPLKNPHCLMVMSAKYRPEFKALCQEWLRHILSEEIFEWDEKPTINYVIIYVNMQHSSRMSACLSRILT